MNERVMALEGRVGRPLDMAGTCWDVIVVGGGHNGLAAAAYLARAGKRVLVVERGERLGGACTLERPFDDPGYLISPCAYLVGLLHPVVIAELDLARHGYAVEIADPSQWSPFLDGTSFTDWADPVRTAASVAALSPRDVDGFFAYQDVYTRIRTALRPADPSRDTWVGDAPTLDEVTERLVGDGEAQEVLRGLPVADLVERHIADRRLRAALHGAGVIGTWAGPRDPGTAWVRAMHNLGTIGGWGYVIGGMGRVSWAIAAAAVESGATLATGTEVVAIRPGDGVELAGGEQLRAPVVVCNADPLRTLALLDAGGAAVDPGWRRRVGTWDVRSPVLKVNCGLRRLPTFPAAQGDPAVHRAMVVLSTGIDDTQAAFAAAGRGEVAPEWCELYFQTAYDPSVAPAGRHIMSVFAQYAPYHLAHGTWAGRRSEVLATVLGRIARFAPDVADCVEYAEVLGPPDIEARVGLSGGHIFQGSCLPEQMWERRMAARTPMPGIYLCGASTHPAGSVVGVNGRNAAAAVMADSHLVGGL